MKKSKIVIPAIAFLALGVAGATTGTLAWYQSQANVTISYASAKITAPTDLLKVGLWNPYGASGDHAAVASASQSIAVTDQITDVVSTKAQHGGDKTWAASYIAGATEQGKYFSKFGLGSDGIVNATVGDDYLYNVTSNPQVDQTGLDDDDATDWGTLANDAAYDAETAPFANTLLLKSVRAGKAYIRFGFFLENARTAADAGAVNVTINSQNMTVTHKTDDTNDAQAIYCLINPAATITSNADTFANIAAGTAVLEGNTATGISTQDSLINSMAQIPYQAKHYYVVTIWADGTKFNTNDKLDEAVVSLSLNLTGTAAVAG